MDFMEMNLNIKELQTRLGLSNAQFAQKLGVHVPSIRAYKAGRRKPGPETLAKLLKLSHQEDKTNFASDVGNIAAGSTLEPVADPPAAPDLDATKNRYAIGLPQRFQRIIPGAEREAQSVLDTLGIEALSPMIPLRVSETKVLWAVWCLYLVDVARKLLDGHNAHNRVVKASSVARYAGRMRPGGGWLQAGDPIKLGMDCALYDGQTRLKAAVVVGDPFVALTILGADVETFRVTDQGVTRTVEQRFQSQGSSFPDKRAKLVVLFHRFEASVNGSDWIMDPKTSFLFDGTMAHRINEHYKSEMDEALDFVHGLRWGIGDSALPKHVAAFFYVLAARTNRSVAQHFIRRIVEGGTTSTALTKARDQLTRRAVQAAKSEDTTFLRETTGAQTKILILAWNSQARPSEKNGMTGVHLTDNNPGVSVIDRLRSLAVPGPKSIEIALTETDSSKVQQIMDRGKQAGERLADKLRAVVVDKHGELRARAKRLLAGV